MLSFACPPVHHVLCVCWPHLSANRTPDYLSILMVANLSRVSCVLSLRRTPTHSAYICLNARMCWFVCVCLCVCAFRVAVCLQLASISRSTWKAQTESAHTERDSGQRAAGRIRAGRAASSRSAQDAFAIANAVADSGRIHRSRFRSGQRGYPWCRFRWRRPSQRWCRCRKRQWPWRLYVQHAFVSERGAKHTILLYTKNTRIMIWWIPHPLPTSGSFNISVVCQDTFILHLQSRQLYFDT